MHTCSNLIHDTVQFSHSVMSNFLRTHGLQHNRPPSPSPTPGACSNSCPSNRWCRTTSIAYFSTSLKSLPASRSFPVSRLFASGGHSIGASASASVLPMNIQGWFPLGLTALILQSMGLSRVQVFSSTTIRRHWFFGAQPSLGLVKSSFGVFYNILWKEPRWTHWPNQ